MKKIIAALNEKGITFDLAMSVDDQLKLDMELFGVAYYTVDEVGNKTRIDPRTIVVMKKNPSRNPPTE